MTVCHLTPAWGSCRQGGLLGTRLTPLPCLAELPAALRRGERRAPLRVRLLLCLHTVWGLQPHTSHQRDGRYDGYVWAHGCPQRHPPCSAATQGLNWKIKVLCKLLMPGAAISMSSVPRHFLSLVCHPPWSYGMRKRGSEVIADGCLGRL